ncbi:MAG TPA: hypothetical protein VMB05_11450 [Solirubrobacteraceae bacterium]|nr:hypothetical protein [Solirubrobacteraceae bacterium]
MATAVSAATAMASEGEVVNAKGELFKGKPTETGGATTFETTGGSKIKCSAFTIGETGIPLTGCESSGIKCNSAGAKAGELLITAIEGKLPRTATKKLVSETKLTSTFEFECGSLVKIKIRGGLLTPAPTEKSLKTEFKVAVKQTKGVQELTEFENEGKEKIKLVLETSINGGAFTQTGAEFTETLLFPEAVEFR